MESPERSGLRLMECLRLRVQDVDFARNQILVRDGKGAKDRITMLAESLKAPLQNHLKKVTAIHEPDLPDGWRRLPPEFAARLMDYGAIARVPMPIRIRRHDKSFYGMEEAGGSDVEFDECELLGRRPKRQPIGSAINPPPAQYSG